MAARPARGREPTPAEAAVLDVYLGAERALLDVVAANARRVVDADEQRATAEASAAATRVRGNVEQVVRGLQRGAAGRVEAVVSAAAQQGTAAAAAELAGLSGGNRDDQHVNRGALDRLAAAVLDRIEPAHMALLRTVDDAFRGIVARALPGQLVGADTRRTATQRALWALADSGLTGFTDMSGRRWSLSAYVEMAVRTAATRAHTDARHDRIRAAGQDLVIVQGSGDRCPKCRPWHGKILTLSGGGPGSVVREHGTRDGEMIEVQVAGSLAAARSAGWGHPQCRCSTAIYLPGVTRIPAEPARDDGQYEARQRQRAIERQIRAAKQRERASLDEPARRRARDLTRAAQARMREHMAANPDLRRRSHREQIGTGNLPGDALRRRSGEAGALRGPATPGRARRPRDMSDAELEREMQGALGRDDMDGFDRLANESDRRDARRVQRREQAAAVRATREEQRAAEFERLLDAGADEEEAVERAYGVSVQRQRRDRAIAQLRASGYSGRNLDELARAAYRDHVYELMMRAEAEVRGTMFNRRGNRTSAAQVEREGYGSRPEARLFTGSDSYARANASPELLEWWDANGGRPTFEGFRADLLGEGGGHRRTTGGGDYYS